jgi:hypothetical protein
MKTEKPDQNAVLVFCHETRQFGGGMQAQNVNPATGGVFDQISVK